MNCPNCNAKLSCGCQKRTASNGAQVCSTCIAGYEAFLKKPQTGVKSHTAPTNITIKYNPPNRSV